MYLALFKQKRKNLLGSVEQSLEDCVQADVLTWIFNKALRQFLLCKK